MGIVVRPVDDASFFIPLVPTTKTHHIPKPNGIHPRRHVDVVADEDGVVFGDGDDEALVTIASPVVRENPHHRACSLDPRSGGAFVPGGSECRRVRRNRSTKRRPGQGEYAQ